MPLPVMLAMLAKMGTAAAAGGAAGKAAATKAAQSVAGAAAGKSGGMFSRLLGGGSGKPGGDTLDRLQGQNSGDGGMLSTMMGRNPEDGGILSTMMGKNPEDGGVISTLMGNDGGGSGGLGGRGSSGGILGAISDFQSFNANRKSNKENNSFLEELGGNSEITPEILEGYGARFGGNAQARSTIEFLSKLNQSSENAGFTAGQTASNADSNKRAAALAQLNNFISMSKNRRDELSGILERKGTAEEQSQTAEKHASNQKNFVDEDDATALRNKQDVATADALGAQGTGPNAPGVFNARDTVARRELAQTKADALLADAENRMVETAMSDRIKGYNTLSAQLIEAGVAERVPPVRLAEQLSSLYQEMVLSPGGGGSDPRGTQRGQSGPSPGPGEEGPVPDPVTGFVNTGQGPQGDMPDGSRSSGPLARHAGFMTNGLRDEQAQRRALQVSINEELGTEQVPPGGGNEVGNPVAPVQGRPAPSQPISVVPSDSNVSGEERTSGEVDKQLFEEVSNWIKSVDPEEFPQSPWQSTGPAPKPTASLEKFRQTPDAENVWPPVATHTETGGELPDYQKRLRFISGLGSRPADSRVEPPGGFLTGYEPPVIPTPPAEPPSEDWQGVENLFNKLIQGDFDRPIDNRGDKSTEKKPLRTRRPDNWKRDWKNKSKF